MRKFLTTLSLSVLIVPAGALVSMAQTGAPQAAKPGEHKVVTPDQLKWGPAPPALPAGAQVAIVDGDPTQPGMFAMRLKFPDGFSIPPHWHPTEEQVVVLSGTFMMGLGDKADVGSMHVMPAGSFSKIPRRTNHYARAKGETVVQVYGMGPFVLNYVNPADDPRKK